MVKYIRFELEEKKPKTNVYAVIKNVLSANLKDGSGSMGLGYKLGTIKWHPQWRKYCFYPETETTYSRGCLDDITTFISKLMDDRKEKKQNQKLCDECIGQNHPAGDYCQECNLREYRK